MTAGAHDAGGGFSRSAGTNVARGVMVIIAAVAVGLLLMFRGINDSSDSGTDDAGGEISAEGTADGGADPGAAGGDTEGADQGGAAPEDTSAATDGADPTSSTTSSTVAAPPRDPSEVRVLVLNGTDEGNRRQGVAAAATDMLKPENYVTLDAKDADINGPSAVFFVEGYQAEANAVAEVYGADPAVVVQPLDPTQSPIADTQDAHIIVRVGSDGNIKV